MKSKKPDHCKGCSSLWMQGIKGQAGGWCCKFGRPAQKTYRHCINTNSKAAK